MWPKPTSGGSDRSSEPLRSRWSRWSCWSRCWRRWPPRRWRPRSSPRKKQKPFGHLAHQTRGRCGSGFKRVLPCSSCFFREFLGSLKVQRPAEDVQSGRLPKPLNGKTLTQQNLQYLTFDETVQGVARHRGLTTTLICFQPLFVSLPFIICAWQVKPYTILYRFLRFASNLVC